jgi:hypothetical protein
LGYEWLRRKMPSAQTSTTRHARLGERPQCIAAIVRATHPFVGGFYAHQLEKESCSLVQARILFAESRDDPVLCVWLRRRQHFTRQSGPHGAVSGLTARVFPRLPVRCGCLSALLPTRKHMMKCAHHLHCRASAMLTSATNSCGISAARCMASIEIVSYLLTCLPHEFAMALDQSFDVTDQVLLA